MPNLKIGLIVEGDGERDAAPTLLTKSLHHIGRYDVFPGQPQCAHGRFKLLRKDGKGLERYIKRSYDYSDEAALLVIIDSEGDCPVTLAKEIAERIRAHGARRPTAVVVAHRMYEAWFLACGPAFVGKSLNGCPAFDEKFIIADTHDEATRGPKSHIEKCLPANRQYKETQDQKPMTSWMDIEMTIANSRSFRRWIDAVSQLLKAIDEDTNSVTP